jgi:hypothetical protein
MVIDLRAQGNANDILGMIFNSLLGLNQEQFKDKLTPIYGERIRPDNQVLAAELNMYTEAAERMKELRKDNDGGKIVANAAKAEQSEQDSVGTVEEKIRGEVIVKDHHTSAISVGKVDI